MKTISEAAKGDFLHKDYGHWGLCTESIHEKIFKSGVEFAQRWIPVEKELPPLGVPVICKYNVFGKEYHWAGTFYTEERIMHFVKKHLQITHWRLIELK